jgi:protein-disulfide isomerase
MNLAKIALGLVLVVALVSCNRPSTAVTSDDMSLGNATAPVTVIEYASASCPHCAQFNNDVFPEFKRRFIDTGRVHYVFREFLTEPVQMAAASFLLARCAGRERYFQVLDAVFHGQRDMIINHEERAGLLRIAQGAGMTEAEFTACVTNEANMRALEERVDRYARDNHIQFTPTFVINGRVVTGEQTIESMEREVLAAEGRPAPAAANSATNAAAETSTNAASPAATNAAAPPATNAATPAATPAATNAAH